MNYPLTMHTPAESIFWPQSDSFMKKSLVVIAGAVLLALASQLSIPLQPVPLTFQSATVVLIGLAGGARLGSYAVIVYLIAGLVGMPVFADFHAGLPTLLGPTGGYLAGFAPAAFISGYLAQKGFARHPMSAFLAACAGVSVIFLMGVAWLSTFTGWHLAITLGVLPYALSEPIKLIVLSFLVPRLWK